MGVGCKAIAIDFEYLQPDAPEKDWRGGRGVVMSEGTIYGVRVTFYRDGLRLESSRQRSAFENACCVTTALSTSACRLGEFEDAMIGRRGGVHCVQQYLLSRDIQIEEEESEYLEE